MTLDKSNFFVKYAFYFFLLIPETFFLCSSLLCRTVSDIIVQEEDIMASFGILMRALSLLNCNFVFVLASNLPSSYLGLQFFDIIVLLLRAKELMNEQVTSSSTHASFFASHEESSVFRVLL